MIDAALGLPLTTDSGDMLNSIYPYRLLLICSVIALVPGASCSRKEEVKEGKQHQEQVHAVYARDWNRFPSILERDTANEVIALGDVHGGYERLVNLLSRAGLIKSDGKSPPEYSWAGGNRLLISVGDLIDKGDQSIEVLALMMTLEAQAPASGGEVIVTLGNHEAEFLANPENKKAHEFVAELQSKGIDPGKLRQAENPYGEWLMNRPLAARVNDWFVAHGGNTSGKTINEMAAKFRREVDKGAWGSKFLIGDDSLLEAQKWWQQNGQSRMLLNKYLSALNVKHIVFGHDPGAFHSKGQIGVEEDGSLFLIDVGMSPAIDYSKGALLIIDTNNNETVATSLDANGARKELWRAAR